MTLLRSLNDPLHEAEREMLRDTVRQCIARMESAQQRNTAGDPKAAEDFERACADARAAFERLNELNGVVKT